MLASAFLLPLCVCGLAFFINFIAIYYHASRAIPFTIMVYRLYIASLVCAPDICSVRLVLAIRLSVQSGLDESRCLGQDTMYAF